MEGGNHTPAPGAGTVQYPRKPAAQPWRRCKPAAKWESWGAKISYCATAVLVGLLVSLQAQTCQGFLAPIASPTTAAVGRRVSSLTNAPVEKQRHRNTGTNSATPWKTTTTRHRVSAIRGGGMVMLLPAAVSSILNPEVVKASTRAVTELLCCCVLGIVASNKGILTPVNVGALAKIVYGIFLPSLLMVNVAQTCVSQPVASLLPIPIFAVVQIGVGLVVSGVAMRLLKIDPNTETGRMAKVSAAFQNSGILPLIFLNALFRGNPEVLSRAIAYVSFYLMGWSPVFWTVGPSITTGHLPGGGGGGGRKNSATDDDNDDDKKLSAASRAKLSLSKRAAYFPSKLKSIAGGATARRVLSPPIVSCMVGLAIGLSPPLRWLFLRKGAPLGPMWSAFGNLAAAYTPSGVLVLAGSLGNAPPGKWFSRDAQKTILAVGLARWLLLPLVTSGLLFSGVKYGLVPQDPILLFVLLVESCMPSAQNSVLMFQVAGLQDAAGRCARTLCTIYLIAIVPVSILLTVFMSALKLV